MTDDRDRLLSAVTGFKGRRPLRRPFDADSCPSPCVRGCNDLADFYNDLGLYKKLEEASRLVRTATAKRKAFVLISEASGRELTGLFEAGAPPPKPPKRLGQKQTAATELAGPGYSAGETAVPGTGVDCAYAFADDSLLSMMDAMRRSNVAVYSVDPRGRVPDNKLMWECFPITASPDPCAGEGAGPTDRVSWITKGATQPRGDE